jgi:protein SCO1/2
MTLKDGRGKAESGARFRWRLVLTQIAIVSVAVALVAGIGKVAYELWLKPPGDAASRGQPLVGGPFAMVDQDGRPADEKILLGKWTAVFFGYSFCPDVCPATLTTLNAAKARMGKDADKLQVVFVSIDPERDTPAQLKTYLSSPAFPKPIIGLTGTPEQVKAMARAYKVYYAKAGDAKPGDRDYLMDHSSAIYVMDPKGQFAKLVDPQLAPDDMAKAVSGAMSGL